MLQFDDVLKYFLGEFGTYQKLCFFLLGLVSLTPVLQMLAPVYILAETDHWCVVPATENISHLFCLNGTDVEYECNASPDEVKTRTIPRELVYDGCDNTLHFSKCKRYDVGMDDIMQPSAPEPYFNRTTRCDMAWEYDKSQYEATVTQKFDLVCDRYFLNALPASIFMLGNLFGSIIFGVIMDKYGRIPGLILSIIFTLIFGILQAFPANYSMFIVTRFLLSVCCHTVVGFVLATELVGPHRRTVVGMIYNLFYSIGYMLLTLYAYFIRDWQTLQLVITVPHVLCLVFLWIIPESPRWLLAVRRFDEAENIVGRWARINRVNIPADLFDETRESSNNGKDAAQSKGSLRKDAFNLFLLPNMRKKTLCLIYIWLVNTLVYFGISFNTSALSGNDYMNAFLSALVEIPATFIAIWMMEFPYFGRRWSLFITMTVGGVACICAALVPSCGDTSWLELVFALIGKCAITASYGMVYIFTVELFPTPVRSIGFGLCSLFSCLGGILAPQLLLFNRVWKPLPFIVFGVTSILGGILTLPLPETRNQKLPETMEEGERFGRKSSRRGNVPGYEQQEMAEI